MSSPQLRRRLTSADASFLYSEKPSAALHIGSTSLLDGTISRDELIKHMRTRIHLVPRYREIAVFDQFNVAHPAWEPDPNFDIDRHVVEVRLPDGATEADLLQHIANMSAPMLPRDRPLWKMVLTQNLPGSGNSAVTSLVHHCMVDGVSGVELLQAITDLERDAPALDVRPFERPDPADPTERSRAAMAEAFDQSLAQASENFKRWLNPQRQMDEFQTISKALASAAPVMTTAAPSTPWNQPVGPKRSHAVVATQMADFRGIRSMLGGTLNDVVLTTLAGGLGRYLRAHGRDTSGVELRAMVPVNVRGSSDQTALGNQVSMYLAPLPVGIVDSRERHKLVTARMNGLKEAGQASGFAMLTRLTESVPAGLQAFAGLMAPSVQPLFNIVCTNVPGPQVPLYLAGRRFETLWPLVPLSMGLGMGCALTSYNGTLFWGLQADPALVPDIDLVAQSIQAAFDDIKQEALVAAAESQPPPPPAASARPQREPVAAR